MSAYHEAVQKYQQDQSSTASAQLSTVNNSTSSALFLGAPRQHHCTVRTAAGEVWKDESLAEWPENDFRLFVGDLAKETTSENLAQTFSCYKSFAKAKVIRNKWDSKARGYGFVSFLDPMDCAKALREMNGKYLGSR